MWDGWGSLERAVVYGPRKTSLESSSSSCHCQDAVMEIIILKRLWSLATGAVYEINLYGVIGVSNYGYEHGQDHVDVETHEDVQVQATEQPYWKTHLVIRVSIILRKLYEIIITVWKIIIR